MSRMKLSRRQFLKAAGAAGALAIPTFLGYGLLHADQGEFPPNLSPYAPLLPRRSQSPGPILVVTNNRADNPFGAYLAEILRAEGLNCFQVADVSALDEAMLAPIKLVLLAEGPLNQSQVELLESFVAHGGRLIAMRPEARLVPMLGLEQVDGSTAEGYLKLDQSHPLGQGTSSESLQFHGQADHYRLAGAEAVAWLGEAHSTTAFPAVTLHAYEQGRTAAWSFDLARNIAYTRQGNPAWVNQERDGADGIRAHDAFLDWLDLEQIAIPQADEHMRLLSRLITELLAESLPLPRLWYFPGAAERMLIATGDSHQNVAFAVEDVLSRVEQRGGHFSVYYTPPSVSSSKLALRKARWLAADLPLVGEMAANPNTLPSPSHIAAWRARGHEFTFHPEVEAGVDAGYQRYWEEFTALGYGPISPTVRTHRILWNGWVETARYQASYGLRMNLDYYHIGPSFQNAAKQWVYGHFTGSGLPMKFIDEQGRVLNIYQQLTQLVDEHLLLGLGGWAELSADEAIKISKQLLTGPPTAVCAQFHVDPFHGGGAGAEEAGRWLEGTLNYAAVQNIPIWSAVKWLDFTEARDETTLEAITWQPDNKQLSFQVVAAAGSEADLTVMVPLDHGQAKLAQLDVDGHAMKPQQRMLGGLTYGWVTVGAGAHQVVATYA